MMHRLATLAGPVILAGFGLAALWVLVPPARDYSPAPDAQPQDLASRLAEHRAEISALIPVTANRPLFQANRRPVAAPEAPAAPAAPAETVLVLVGIIGNGDDRIALVRPSTSTELIRVEAGGRVGPWQILSVDISSVTVSKDDGSSFTLRLDG
jgi:hypothetical protein